MKAKDIRSKSVSEIGDELLSLRKAQFSLRMQLRTQQLTNSAEIRKVRRDIARVKTVLNEKMRSQ
jgi:large subunit ribosomal protein L29